MEGQDRKPYHPCRSQHATMGAWSPKRATDRNHLYTAYQFQTAMIAEV